MKTLIAAAGAVCLISSAAPAAAQTGGRSRVFLSFNGGSQPSNAALSERFEFDSNVETATVDVAYPSKVSVLVDGGAGIRLWKQFGAGVAASYSSNTGSARIEASIPHPFIFDQPRPISGEQAIDRTETSGHLQLLYFVPTRGKLRAVLSAGPSIVSLTQDVVTDVRYSETYPYDTATFTRATTKSVSGTAVGFNVGLDVQWMFARHLGVGALVRFTRAHVDLEVESGRGFTVDTGGVQAGGGIRILF